VQLTLEQQDLTQASMIVAGMLKKSQTTLPVLSNLLIEAEGGIAHFIGTDLESFVRVRVPAEIGGSSARMTLPADKLSELVSLLPAGQRIVLADEGGQVAIKTEQATYNLVTLPADDYPQWNAEDSLTSIVLPQKELRRLLDAVLYALPPKDHRRVLMGALFEINDMVLTITATDGKKLSRIRTKIQSSEGDSVAQCVISGKLLNDMKRILSDEGPVRIEIGNRQVAFLVDNVEYRTNVIEGKYPDCNAVIPKEFPFQVKLNRTQFLLAARRAGVVSEDKNKSIILRLSENNCEFTSMAADVGRFSGNVTVNYQGNPIEIAFNYMLMIETLNSFGHPEITLKIKSEQSPTVLSCDAEMDHLCVLMPIKLAELRAQGISVN
jgi:DNA polymerase-3 subunit beta